MPLLVRKRICRPEKGPCRSAKSFDGSDARHADSQNRFRVRKRGSWLGNRFAGSQNRFLARNTGIPIRKIDSRSALQIMRRQKAGVPDNRIEPLTDFEQLVLTAIKTQRTPRWNYLDRLTDTVRELSNYHYQRSSVLETLKSLEERYLVFSWSPDLYKHPDEAGRTYFFLSSIGEASRKQTRKASRRKP
jgi:hypothetical protein